MRIIDRGRCRRRWLLLVVAAICLPGCDWLEHRFKTCHDVRVDLINSEQTLAAVYLAGPEEGFTSETLLASGASRQSTMCVDPGDRKKFRAADTNGQILGVVHCVVSHTYDDGATARVIWTLGGLICEGW